MSAAISALPVAAVSALPAAASAAASALPAAAAAATMYTEALQDAVLDSYKRCVTYATDAVQHYEHFMDHMLPFIVTEYSRLEVPSPDGARKHVVQLRNVVVQRPAVDDTDSAMRGLRAAATGGGSGGGGGADVMTPMEARNRGLTYSAQILVDIEHTVWELQADGVTWGVKGTPVVNREMPLLEMPVMLRSKYCWLSRDAAAECWMDLGGYFIVRGNAKVLQPQKVQRNNVHLVKGGKHQSVDMDCRSRRDDEKFRSTSTLYMHLNGSPPIITVDIPFLKAGLPVAAVFRLLGLHDRDAIDAVLWDTGAADADGAARRMFSANYAHPLMSVPLEAVLDTAGMGLHVGADAPPEKVRRQVAQQVAGELLPHVGFDDAPVTRIKKLAYLAIIIHRMLDVYLGRADPDDRDFEGHKAVQMTAGVLSVMFRQQFAATMKTLRNRIYDRCKKGKDMDISALMTDALSRDVLKAFSEGEVTVAKEASNAGTSVIQLAQQINPLGIQTHIQRISTALPRDGKYKQLRGVDPTQLWALCLADDHEVLTNRGFMGMAELRKAWGGDILGSPVEPDLLVVGYDAARSTLVYERPARFVYNAPVAQEMIDFTQAAYAAGDGEHPGTKCNYVSLLTTPDHDMYIRKGTSCGGTRVRFVSRAGGVETPVPFTKVKAGALEGEGAPAAIQFLGRASGGALLHTAPAPPYADLDVHDADARIAFCELFGCWLRGGGINAGRAYLRIAAPEKADHLRHVFTRVGLKWSPRPDRRSSIVSVSDARFNTCFEGSLDAAHDKCMPAWVWGLDLAHSRALLRGIQHADGDVADDKVIYTTSTRVRDDLIRLALHAGYTAYFNAKYEAGDIRVVNGVEVVARQTSWAVRYAEDKQFSQPTLKRATRDIRRVSYTGPTWCVTMPSTFLVTRRVVTDEAGVVIRASRPVIIHNCPTETPEGHGCLSVDAQVLLADGVTTRAIGDVVADPTTRVWSVNPATLQGEPTAIEKPFVRSSAGLGMFALRTLSGRVIRATGDHPFLTQSGWKRADALAAGELVAVSYHPQPPADASVTDADDAALVLTESTFLAATDGIVKASRTALYATQLTAVGLLPLAASNSAVLAVLARIAGFVLADGSLCVYDGIPRLSAAFGTQESALGFARDVAGLGLRAYTPVYHENSIIDRVTGRVAVHHIWQMGLCPSLATLLIALGMTYGKKTENPTRRTPAWIMGGPPAVQREWLAGLYGGDGCRPNVAARKGKPRAVNIQIGLFAQHKAPEHAASLVDFMEETAALLRAHGIEASVTAPKAVSATRVRLAVEMVSTNDNVFRFLEEIGYRYDQHKQEAAARVREYLAYKALKIAEVRSAIEAGGKVPTTTRLLMPRDALGWEEWTSRFPTRGLVTFVALDGILRIPDEPVADFTTVSDNHSFVANGFVTHNCGLLQNLSSFARVRVGTPLKFVAAAVLALGDFARANGLRTPRPPMDLVRPFTSFADLTRGSRLVLVNGDPVAVTDDEDAFVTAARAARRASALPYDCSIVRGNHGVCVSSDMGVIVFPLLYVPHLGRLPEALAAAASGGVELWTALQRAQLVDYIDAYELLEYRVAFTPADVDRATANGDAVPFTHLALHPSGFMGTCAGSVPWADHDQAPRVAYQAGMVKQAISTPAANLRQRMDMGYAYELWYPQAPLADTAIARATGMNDWPLGENLIIAIAPYGGWSQEDSIIRNRGSVQRGSGRVTVYRTFKAVCRRRGGGETESFEHPLWRGAADAPKCEGLRGGGVNYDKICVDGLPEEGTPLGNGDVIIGRVLHSSEAVTGDGLGETSVRAVRRDRSVVLTCEPSERYVVDKVIITSTKEGQRAVRVRLRTTRVPQEGDKISSRHGQKGTIGVLLSEEDMPFVAHGPNAGMRPDAIINLHSVNGRMTIAKLLEMLFSSLGLVAGEFIDATPFRHVNARWAMDQLTRSGYGTEEYMIDGTSGELMARPWFIGPCFYHTLKHMVLDKITMRQRGQRAILTRQPLDGRANQGGQRMGGMEVDALLAHGAAFCLDDRSRIASDAHTALVCTHCGHVGDSKEETLRDLSAAAVATAHAEACRLCGALDSMVCLPTTYCYSRLLLPELATCGVKVVHKFSAGGDDGGSGGASVAAGASAAAGAGSSTDLGLASSLSDMILEP